MAQVNTENFNKVSMKIYGYVVESCLSRKKTIRDFIDSHTQKEIDNYCKR